MIARFRDPQLYLPPGEWLIAAVAVFKEGTECEGAQKAVRATVTLTVVE